MQPEPKPLRKRITRALKLGLLATFGSALVTTSAIAEHHGDKPTLVLITNVSVWDGTSDKAVQGMDVLVEGNKIKSVGKGIKASGAVVIDGKGGTVTPGLIDMHQHLTLNGGTDGGNNWDAYVQGAHASRAAEYLLRSGFTTIRDIAGNSLGLKRAVNSGILPGPRIYSAGPALGPTGGHSDWGSWVAAPGEANYQTKVQNTMVVDGVDEWLRAGRWIFRNGGDFLKVMSGGGVASTFDPIDLNSPSPAEMEAAVQVANEYGSYVAIHGYTDAAYNKSLDAGVKSFEHGFLISEETVKRMAKEGVWWSWQPYGSYNTFGKGNFPDWFTADMREKGAAVAEGAVQVPKWMKKHGVQIVNGSDMFGWDNWHNALVNVTYPVEIPGGVFSSLDAMIYSTSNAGKMLKELSAPSRNPFKGADLGVVKKGAWADILIWDGDPTRNIKLILKEENLKMVMKDGKVYKNLLVDPTHESFRAAPAPAGHSFNM
jgi:imidazolonepropionase-like amidohydrolase